MYLYGLIISFFSFVLQVWPRLINRYFGIDTWRHLMYAEYIRKHKKLPTCITDRYLISSPFGYPPVILIFLALFPKQFSARYQFIFSPLFDFVHNYLIFLATFFFTNNLLVAIIAQTIAALTPITVIEASNLNTRVLSYLFFTLSFFSLLIFTTTNNYSWLAIAFIMLCVLFFTHKLSIQMYLFIAIGFSIIEKNPFYILFFLSAFIATFIFGRKTYRAIFYDHIGILNFWRKNYILRFAHQFRGVPKDNDYYDFVQKIYLLSAKNPLIYILGNNPWVMIFALLLIAQYFHFFSYPQITQYPILAKLINWSLFSLLAAILTLSFKKLNFLGEGHRYLEYGIFPLSVTLGIFSIYFFNSFGLVFVSVFLFSSVILLSSIIYVQKKTILKDRTRTITKGLWNVIDYLNRTDGKKVRLIVFPFTLCDALAYFLKGRVLATDSGRGLILLKDVFPIIRIPFVEIVKKYNLNYILFDENYVTLEELKLKEYKIVIHEDGYYLLKV